MMQIVNILLLSVVIIALTSSACGSRILALLPFPGKSHHIFFQAILKALALKGHQVTVYSPFPQDKPLPNYRDVYVNTTLPDDFVPFDMIMDMLNTSPIAGVKEMWKELDFFTEGTLRNEKIQELTKSTEKYDLVITETFFGQEAFLSFGHKFNAPTIALQTFLTFGVINRAMGNSLALTYVPDPVLPFTDHMSLYERLINTYSILSTLFSFYYEHIPKHQAMMHRHFQENNPTAELPLLDELIQNISVVLVNSHPTIHYAQPLTSNIIPVGGIHVSKERKPLPKNIQKFMDEAKHGVIYFSLGTFIPDHQLPQEILLSFIKVFKTLPQKVLWKTRAENISGLPGNVLTAKWFPQQDILAHPNCMLFLTHGGLLSLLEAAYAGVPVVGIPFYADQPMNVRYYEQQGIGIGLDFKELSEESISRAVKTVLTNPMYKVNAQKLSRIYRDLPMSSTDTALFWVEYVLRHGGAQHLRPASAHLTWYQLCLLDVIAVVLAATTAVLVTLYLIYRKIYLLCRSRKRQQSSKKRN